MPFEFMREPKWLTLDDETQRRLISLSFELDVESDPKWPTIDSDTQRQLRAIYSEDANAVQQEVKMEAAPESRGFLGRALAATGRGMLGAVESAGQAFELVGDFTPREADVDTGVFDLAGRGMADWAQRVQKEYDWLKQDKGELAGEPGFVQRGILGAFESAPQAMGIWGAAKGGAVLGGLVGGVPGAVALGITGGLVGLVALFGAGTYGKEYTSAYDEVARTRPNATEEERREVAHRIALGSAAFEVGTELPENVAAMFLLFGSRALTGPIAETLKELAKKPLKELIKGTGKQMLFETTGEMVAGGGQAWVRQREGLSGPGIGEGVLESIIPAMTMSLFFGAGAAGLNQYQSKRTMNELNSEDPFTRVKAIQKMAQRISVNTRDKELGIKWGEAAMSAVADGRRFDFDEKIVDFAQIKTAEDYTPPEPADPILSAPDADTAIREFEESLTSRSMKAMADVGFSLEDLSRAPIEEARRHMEAQGKQVAADFRAVPTAFRQDIDTERISLEEDKIAHRNIPFRGVQRDLRADVAGQMEDRGKPPLTAPLRREQEGLRVDLQGRMIEPARPAERIPLRGEQERVRSELAAKIAKGADIERSLAPLRGEQERARANVKAQIDAAANRAATSPLNDKTVTEKQLKAGTYEKGHLRFAGMEVAIENPRGSVRSGTDKEGREWSVEVKNHYGYFNRTKGKNGDQIDVIIGPDVGSKFAYIVDQVDPETGKFDEHKTLVGFRNETAAREGYLSNYEEDWQGLGAITEVPLAEFKDWIGDGTRKKDSFAELQPAQADRIADTINETMPGNALAYDGPQKNIDGKPDLHQWTAKAGPAKGATFSTETASLDVVRNALSKKIADFKEDQGARTIREHAEQVLPGEVGGLEETLQEVGSAERRKEEIVRQRTGESGQDLQRKTQEEPGGAEQRIAEPTVKIGDTIRFIPNEKYADTTEGMVQDVIKNQSGDRGYHILSPTKTDPGRVVRVWDKSGNVELLKSYEQPEPITETKAKPEPQRVKTRYELNAADLAADYKAQGIERQSSYSQFVKDRDLKPEMDAGDFFKIYDSVTPKLLETVGVLQPPPKPDIVKAPITKDDISTKEQQQITALRRAQKAREVDRFPDLVKVPDKEIPPKSPIAEAVPPKPDATMSALQISKAARERGEKTLGTLASEVIKFRGKGGVATEVKGLGLKPAFRHEKTGEIFKSLNEEGKESNIHLLEGIPEKYVTERHADGDVIAVSPEIESGFIKDGKFYTRNDAVELTKKSIPPKPDVAKPAEAIPEKPPIEVVKTPEGTEVKVDITEKKANALSPKEQKAYLIDEIDKAIASVPETYSEDTARVTIHVPGDGDFSIFNDTHSLTEFKKRVKYFPGAPAKPSLSKTPSVKPTKKRITDFAGSYYNDYIPQKESPIDSEPNHYKDGYFFSNRAYAVKTATKPAIKGKIETENAPDISRLISELKIEPATIMAQTYEGVTGFRTRDTETIPGAIPTPGRRAIPMVHIMSDSGKHFLYDAKYIDSIFTEHPKADVFIDESGMAVFKKGNTLVGVVMPVKLTNGIGTFEGLTETAMLGYEKKYGTGVKPLYSVANIGDRVGVQRSQQVYEDVRSLLDTSIAKKNVTDVTLQDNGEVWIKTKSGHTLTVEPVETIEPNQAAFKIGYNRQQKNGEVVSGSYQENVVKISPMGDKWTVAHEMFGHWMEDIGIISPLEIEAMKAHIRGRVKRNEFTSQNPDDIGGVEDRAQFIASQLRERAQLTRPIERIIQKIRDFIDKLVNLFTRTAGGVVRDIESGKIFGRKAADQSVTGEETDRQTMYQKAAMPLFELKTPETTYQETTEPLTEEDFIAMRSIDKNVKMKAAAALSKSGKDITKEFSKLLVPIYTKLEMINKSLASKVRRLDFDTGTAIEADEGAALPLLKKARAIMSRDDFSDWHYARENAATAKIDELVLKYNLRKEYDASRAMMDKLRMDAIDVGLHIGEIEGEYWPRVVKDLKGLYASMGAEERGLYDQALLDKAAQLGVSVTELDDYIRSDIITNIILRGPTGLGQPGATKERKFAKIPPALDKFYMHSDAALIRHIHEMRTAIEARKFFGKIPEKVREMKSQMYRIQARVRDLNEQIKADVGNEKLKKKKNELIHDEKMLRAGLEKYASQRDFRANIGAYIDELIVSGEISHDQQQEVNEILTARFHQRGPHGAVRAYKNISYIDTMGSLISALTQIGDMAWVAYEAGVIPALRHAGNSILKESKITRKDVGVSRLAEEFADAEGLGKAVSWVLRAAGLEKIDAIGKESLLNAALEKYQRRAKSDPDGLRKEIYHMFGKDTDGVILDLQSGEITADIKFLTYSRLADFQPIGLSEMPEMYLRLENGRIFYMLKTFTIKQFDAFRRECFHKIRTGNKEEKIQGVKNLLRLGMFFVLANAGADELKDFILNRDTDFNDRVVDNVLRLAGASKFVVWKARTEGLPLAIAQQVLPPFKFLTGLSKDIYNAGDDKGLEIVGSIPLVGKLAYWHIGRGTSKREDLWNRRLTKHKAKVRKVKEKFDTAQNKMEFMRDHKEELAEYNRVNRFQGTLNKYRHMSNVLKSQPETPTRVKRIKQLETKRTKLIKDYLSRR